MSLTSKDHRSLLTLERSTAGLERLDPPRQLQIIRRQAADRVRVHGDAHLGVAHFDVGVMIQNVCDMSDGQCEAKPSL